MEQNMWSKGVKHNIRINEALLRESISLEIHIFEKVNKTDHAA